jgi:TPR repeat protein
MAYNQGGPAGPQRPYYGDQARARQPPPPQQNMGYPPRQQAGGPLPPHQQGRPPVHANNSSGDDGYYDGFWDDYGDSPNAGGGGYDQQSRGQPPQSQQPYDGGNGSRADPRSNNFSRPAPSQYPGEYNGGPQGGPQGGPPRGPPRGPPPPGQYPGRGPYGQGPQRSPPRGPPGRGPPPGGFPPRGPGRGPPPNGGYGPGPNGPPRGYGMNGGPPGRGGYDPRGPPPGWNGPGPRPGPGGPPPNQRPRQPMMQQASPKPGFDNQFSAHPPAGPQMQQPQRSVTMPIEAGMQNMNMGRGRPSLDGQRPQMAGMKPSTNSYHSENSRYSSDMASYDNSSRESSERNLNNRQPDPYAMGPLSRSTTMPVDNARPGTSQGNRGPGGFDVGNRLRDPIEQRSNTTTGFGPRQDFDSGNIAPLSRAQTFDIGPPSRAQTFDTGAAASPARHRDALDEYMPDFESKPVQQRPLRDPVGLPLDTAPGITRPGTGTGVKSPPPLQQDDYMAQQHQGMNRARSSPNLRGQANGYNGEDAPPMPNYDPRMNGGYQNRGPTSPLYDQNGQGPNGYPPQNYGAQNAMGGYGQPNGLGRIDTNQNGWANDGPMSAPPGGRMQNPMSAGGMQPPMSAHPDALPAHPMPVRMGLLEQQQQRGAPHNRQFSNEQSGRPRYSEEERPRPPSPPKEPPVTLAELQTLRDQVKARKDDHKTHFKLVQKLVEAIEVLADEGGRADAKTKLKNREKFTQEAHKLTKKLVSNQYPDAVFFLGDCYSTGRLGLAVDAKEAFNLYVTAAKLGNSQAAYRAAVCCEVGGQDSGTRKDPVKAVQWYRRAAQLGDVDAMYKLGLVLLRGLLSQKPNSGEAVMWLNKAIKKADENHPHALHELGLLYENPPTNPENKVVQDLKASLDLFEQAAKLGFTKSQARLGKAFEKGELGVPMDDRASIHWYTKAAAQGEPEAELALSGWYLTGSRGVLDQSDAEAYLWARKAAMKEYAKAEFAMGYYSEVGIGCRADLEDAKRWYGRAACKLISMHWIKY